MKKVIYIGENKSNTDVTKIVFPTGEKHIRIKNLSEADDVVIVYKDPTGDVMQLGMAVDICRRANVFSITLVMPFVPFARQDRIADEGDPLSIKVFANFINSMKFDRVVMVDPHSDVTPALFDNCIVIPQHEVVGHTVKLIARSNQYENVIIAPDLGAAKKTKLLQDHLYNHYQYACCTVQCDKVRDPRTGKITKFRILDGDVKDKACIIVDDICDGGGTFLGLGLKLREAGASRLYLVVTHGIFSKGTSVLSEMFRDIMCSNSFPSQPNVSYFPIEELKEYV